MNKTYIPKNLTKAQSQWYVIDAKNKHLGRLSTTVSSILLGKYNIHYTPHVNLRNYVVIINTKDVNLTGQKRYQKIYKRHSGRPGGLKIRSFEQVNNKTPNKIIEQSIKGMLPKNTLGRKLFTQLKVYSNHIHPHEAQQPETFTLS